MASAAAAAARQQANDATFLLRLLLLALFLLLRTASVDALMCYICSQTELGPPAECPVQFQYDCSSYARSFPAGTPILCRTMLKQIRNDSFTVQKQCIAAPEHHSLYPDSRHLGCETAPGATPASSTSYCLCERDFCNSKSFAAQSLAPAAAAAAVGSRSFAIGGDGPRVVRPIARLPAAAAARPPPPRHLTPQQRASFNANVHIDEAKEAEAVVSEDGVATPGFVTAPAPPPATSSPSPPVTPRIIQTTTRPAKVTTAAAPRPRTTTKWSTRRTAVSQTTTATTLLPLSTTTKHAATTYPQWISTPATLVHFNERPTSRPVQGLVCMVCGETGLPDERADCRTQHAVDCASEFAPGAAVYCFTRQSKLSDGKHAVEKLCVTDRALIEEYGDAVDMDGCGRYGDATSVCVCSDAKCNEAPITRQQHDAAARPPSIVPDDDQLTASVGLLGSSACYVCGETDLSYPVDCGATYEYDCGLQYPSGTSVHCLTRQTRLSSGLFSIEKRCISSAEHVQHYPENRVVMEGCSSAWDGYVEYCVCRGDLCNAANMTTQQRLNDYKGVPKPLPPPAVETTTGRAVVSPTDYQAASGAAPSPPRQTPSPTTPSTTTSTHSITAARPLPPFNRPLPPRIPLAEPPAVRSSAVTTSIANRTQLDQGNMATTRNGCRWLLISATLLLCVLLV